MKPIFIDGFFGKRLYAISPLLNVEGLNIKELLVAVDVSLYLKGLPHWRV